MQRRNFIKSISCLTCATALTSGCKNLLIFDLNLPTQQEIDLPKDFLKNLKNDKFYYKSKKDLPKAIRLEACSLCQLDCPACNVRLLEKNVPKDWLGYLKFKDFKKFIDDNDFETIELSNKGEIFLNPELDKIIKYAYEKNINLTANVGVNLNTVSEKTLENLVKYQFKEMKISIDGATPETYKIYRRGGDFNTVINNIKTINKFKKQYNSESPKLKWQFILFGHNEHEIELAKKKAGKLGMEIKFKQNYNCEYSPCKNLELIKKLTNLSINQSKEELGYMDSKNKNRQVVFACRDLFYAPQIDYNGNLLGCCSMSFKNFKTNVFKDGYLNALNSPDYIYAKKMLTDLTIEPKRGIICTNCTRYRYLKNTKQELIL